MLRIATMALFLVGLHPLCAQRLLDDQDLPGRRAAATQLQAVLAADARASSDAAVRTTTLQRAAEAARTGLAEGTAARARLDAAIEASRHEPIPAKAREGLAIALGDLVDTLTFEPLKQAELPKGFPGFRAVDELELREYPAYRMVKTAMRGGSNGAFWPLFRHIESNGIAMTTPVQVDFQAGEGEQRADREATMAFLYGDPGIGEVGPRGNVEVVDVPAMTVLSIGAIGDDRRSTIEALRTRLDAWLAAQGGTWRAAGPLRTMGYNSPMVRRDRRYFEVQLPVVRVEPKRLVV